MRRLVTNSARLALPILLLSVTCAAGRCAEFPLRSPQVAFNSAGLQATLNAWDGGINALSDQLDAQVVSFTGSSRTIDFECQQGNGFEFGVYDPNAAGTPAPCPLFTATTAPGGWASCRLVGDSALFVVEYDPVTSLVRTANFPWAAHMNFGLYATGPGGTWYSQDSRNAGNPHALTYGRTGGFTGSFIECFETGEFEPSRPDAFSSLLVSFAENSCGAPSSRASRALGTDCTPAVTSTWGALKLIYR